MLILAKNEFFWEKWKMQKIRIRQRLLTKCRLTIFTVKVNPQGIFRRCWSHFWAKLGAKIKSSYCKNTLKSSVLCWFWKNWIFLGKVKYSKFRIKQRLLTKSRINSFVVKGGPKGIFCIMGPLLVWKKKSWKSWKKKLYPSSKETYLVEYYCTGFVVKDSPKGIFR